MTREEWLLKRTFTGGPPDVATLMVAKRATATRISVVLPARDVEDTVGEICESIVAHWMTHTPLVDELIVIDGASRDRTAQRAGDAGAVVIDERTLLARVPAAGKGAAMWRSLAAATGDVVVWIDADISAFDPDFVSKLVAPLLGNPEISYVKGYYERPLGTADGGGGRVTEICARPLINRFQPALAGFVQPLSGEAAGRRTLLDHLPFFSGYAVEIGLLWDIHAAAGLAAMAQVDLGVRHHRNQPTVALGRMAYEITEAVLRRADTGAADATLGPYTRPIARAGGFVLERTPTTVSELPPMASIPFGERT